MHFCGNSSSLSEPWVDRGFSHCFLETTSSSIMGGFIILFGGIQVIMYRRFSTRIDRRLQPQSCLYKLQLILSLCMALQSIVRIVLEATVVGDKQIYVYQIMSSTFYAIMYPMSIVVLVYERRRMLPSIPSRGHGLVLLLFWTMAFIYENLAFISWYSPEWWWQHRDESKKIELGLWIVRYICTLFLFALGFKAPGLPGKTYQELMERVQQMDDEEEGLIPRQEPQRSTWSNVSHKLRLLFPYMWPKKSVPLQICVLVCLVLLCSGRVVNLFIPIYYKKIVDSMTPSASTLEDSPSPEQLASNTLTLGPLRFRWDYVLMYVFMKFLQGGGMGTMGFLNNTRSLLWIWVQQYTTREVGVKLYAHLHGLSLRWHLSRKTGEVLRVMDRGTTSINQLLSYILFQIVPTIVDIIIAIVYFLATFDIWFAVIIFITMALFLSFTILITEWRTKYRRKMNLLDNERNAKGVDSLLNFETVKYYGAEDFEVGRYRDAVVQFQKAEWISTASLNFLNTAQNLVITFGFAAGALLAAWYVSQGKAGLTVGDYVLFATYINQLYAPLNWLGTYYRMIQQSFIDMENMFDLLSEKQEVKDEPNAKALQLSKGAIEFDNVCFYYQPEKPILKNVSFVVPPGHTVALVGPSGSGKSTIIRLLFRFYDVHSGCILFDGENISQVRQTSLRQAIGVVPQDTVLFNENIRYNIRYGRIDATDEELEEASKAADIHDRILTFPDGYNTKVGERGLKLSGGEKQRVAIARTILKSPQIVLLDEATSALDTQTERNIQSSLAKVCENRTTIIVAHRLSTIIHAHQILVLRDGEIVERGTHDDLLAENGVYCSMWLQQQSKAEDSDSGEGSGSEVIKK